MTFKNYKGEVVATIRCDLCAQFEWFNAQVINAVNYTRAQGMIVFDVKPKSQRKWFSFAPKALKHVKQADFNKWLSSAIKKLQFVFVCDPAPSPSLIVKEHEFLVSVTFNGDTGTFVLEKRGSDAGRPKYKFVQFKFETKLSKTLARSPWLTFTKPYPVEEDGTIKFGRLSFLGWKKEVKIPENLWKNPIVDPPAEGKKSPSPMLDEEPKDEAVDTEEETPQRSVIADPGE